MLTPGAFEHRRSLDQRLAVLRASVSIAFGVLAIGFWVLQVVGYTKYHDIAENQHIRSISLRAPRGVLFDRTGRVLVENKDSFTIAIVREQSPNSDHNVDQAIHALALATGIDEDHALEEVWRHRKDPLFRPIPIIEHATFAQVAAVTARRLELPEVVVQQVPTRAYPPDGLAGHLFGYVNEIQESQVDRPEFAGLQAGAMVGQAGIEKAYNPLLMGRDGKLDVIVNSRGREIDKLRQEDPAGGERLQLTIDYDLQHALEQAFKANGFAGAAAFMDPRTGEVLALTSQPGYDPNDFANGLDRTKWASLTSDPLKPLQDRLLQGRYSPGSTFKIVMAIAALSERIITPGFTVSCPGSITLYDHPFHCDKKDGHGPLDLRHALEQSCDVYFYKLASMVPIDTIHAYAEKLGLVGKTGIDLPGEVEGLVPSTAWKLKTTGERWYPGETISVGIGQGPLAVTPISLATMIAAVANGGTIVTPHVVRAIDEGRGWVPVQATAPRAFFPMSPTVLEPVRDGLWLAVNGAGTATLAQVAGHEVVGKTGTAQVISTEGAKVAKSRVNLKDNSWFVFYAPRENPEIAGVVFAEHAGWGATASAPMARYVLETYFAKKEGRAPPTLTILADGAVAIGGGAIR